MELVCAVQHCRLIKILRNPLQCRKENNHCPADVFPDSHDPYRSVSRPFPQQPRHIVIQNMKDIDQQIINQPPVAAVKHVLKDQPDNHP